MLITVKFSLVYIGDKKNFEHSFIIPQEFTFLSSLMGPFRLLICSDFSICRELLAVSGDFAYSPNFIVS